jgi:hypothetical protein
MYNPAASSVLANPFSGPIITVWHKSIDKNNPLHQSEGVNSQGIE